MNTRSLIILLLSVVLIGGMLSCKKKTNDNPFGNVRITRAEVSHNGAITRYQFFYDTHSNIDSIALTGDGTSAGYRGFRKFRYYGTSYDITDETNFSFTVFAYNNGLIFKVLVADTMGMIYNGAQLGAIDVFTRTTTYPYYVYNRTYYNWKNGDLNTVVAGGVTTQYTYDESKNGQPGDPLRIRDILKYGRTVIRTIHLPTELSKSGAWTERYFYQFDGAGRIGKLTMVANNNGIGTDDTTVYSYSY